MPGRIRDCASLQLSIASTRDRAAALDELRAFFAIARRHEFAEICVDHDPFPSLTALVHGDAGWLMYLRYEGDAGFSSRNPDDDGPRDRTLEFMLSNGQVDAYPTAWTYPTETVFDALLRFAGEARAPETISWFNDSGDGAAGPDTPFEPLP